MNMSYVYENQTNISKKVNSISDLLFLKGNKRLRGTDCPVYVVGKYKIAPVVMFAINPGYSSKNNPTEDNEARKSWNRYLELYKNFYKYFESNHFESPYYNSLRYLISGLVKRNIPFEQKWQFFDRSCKYGTNILSFDWNNISICIFKITIRLFTHQQIDFFLFI